MRKIPRTVLARWVALEDGGGIKAVRARIRLLWVLGLLAWLTAVGVARYGDLLWGGLILAAIAGWLLAETNALRSRLRQWPSLSEYLDWKRIREELKDAL